MVRTAHPLREGRAMSTQAYPIAKAIVLGFLLAVGLVRPVHAVDGVFEIKQARAKAGGVTPGDMPFFPVTIDRSASYRLTSNLDVTDASARPEGTAAENTSAIQVNADNVTIDLNGFTIKGPTVCSGDPLMCTPTGEGSGIEGNDPHGVAVVNGIVRGMGAHGVFLRFQSRVDKVLAADNARVGIHARLVTDCTAEENGGIGIEGTTVTNCNARSNAFQGISATTVANCTAIANGSIGINAVAVTGSSANSNTHTFQIFAPGIAGHNICGFPHVPCP
jgi:hypothetical protein